MKNKELIQSFSDIANKYLDALCGQFGLSKADTMWIGEEVGGVVEVSDYFISFDEIRFIVDNNIGFNEFDEWYDYVNTLKMINYDICTPTLKSWHEGCPRKTKSEIEKLKQLKKNVEEAEEILRIEIEKQKNN